MIKADKYILGISGGKDSAALAIYMTQNYPDLDIDYFFTDTGEELPEVYDYLNKLEVFLSKGIIRLNSSFNFKHYLREYKYFLPNAQSRWCTSKLKILPLEEWIKPDLDEGKKVVSFVAIRADEPYREGQRSTNKNYFVELPFRNDGINKKGVHDLLQSSGLGVPKYYEWRSRSGCTFCFFQRKIEWVMLMEKHYNAFERAKEIEELSLRKGAPFTWLEDGKLEELENPERISKIKSDYEARKKRALKKKKLNPLNPNELLDDDDIFGQSKFCISCHK